MKIGILGIGHIGKTLAQKLAASGNEVKVANSRGPASVEADVLSTGARAAPAAEVVSDVDVVILSVPMGKMAGIAPLIAGVPAETTIIDTSNYYPARDGVNEAIDAGEIESVWVSRLVGRPIVKAWNAIGSDSLARKGLPKGTPGRIAIPVAGDQRDARRIAMELVEETGFDAVDAGTLAESWRQQPGAPCYCTDITSEEMLPALARADRARLVARRDLAFAAILERMGSGVNPDAEYGVRLSRALFL